MKKLILGSANLLKGIKVSILAMIMVSIFGGFLLSKVLYGIENVKIENADKLRSIEESLDEATIAFGRQIQEWKDMLLRASDTLQYSKHQQAFIDSSVAVQYALMRTSIAMRGIGIDASEIELLQNEHKSLLASYLRAHTLLNPDRSETVHLVDQQVIGVDRDFQKHMAAAKDNLERSVKQQLADIEPSSKYQYFVIAAIGLALLSMALLGLLIAHLFHRVAED
ncbi:MAG: hypothetical protein IPI97_14405 [Nitrosomonas sp.]|nr:hypothetical protein [Nitrosomonas sp.]